MDRMKKTISFPVPKKKPASTGDRAYEYAGEMRTTQFAQEQMAKDIAALKKQCDGLAKLDKAKDFAINLLTNRLKRVEDRVTRKDAE